MEVNDKIELGEYIRTKNGEIAKIDKCYGKDIGYKNMEIYRIDIYSNTCKGFIIYKEDILKHSKNIIDLIEVGDIVRVFMEDDIDGEDTNIFEVIGITTDGLKIGLFGKDLVIDFLPAGNIRGIVTKEQFKEMEYRV